ncbi:MAG: S8 family serine peptidase, partial [Lysobacter sp.]
MPKLMTKTSIALAIAAAAAIAGAAVGLSGADGDSAAPVGGAPVPPAAGTAQTVSGATRYIVVYREAPLSTYKGGLKGLPAPMRLEGFGRARRAVAASAEVGRVDVQSSAARHYVDHLGQVQRNHEQRIGREIGRSLRVQHRMRHALNAVITEMTASEAARVGRLPEVQLVEAYREYEQTTDTGPTQIGAPALWNAVPVAYRGEGVVIGIIDSGINFGSPGFAAVDDSGYRHINPRGTGVYLGTCAPGGIDEGRCNDKLIGGYDFICGNPANICGTPGTREEPGFADTNSHGSHVASTAGGNAWTARYKDRELRISGVAPHANIIAYDACYTRLADNVGPCPSTATARAIDQAIADGVDVINYSISGGTSPWGEAVSLAFLNATDAGIYVAAA